MNERVQAVVDAASKLTRMEQLEVAERIMKAAQPTLSKVDQAWLDAGREQMAAIERGELELFDADEVLAEMRAWSAARRAKQRAKR